MSIFRKFRKVPEEGVKPEAGESVPASQHLPDQEMSQVNGGASVDYFKDIVVKKNGTKNTGKG